MNSPFKPYILALRGLWPILFRHVFLLVNFIIFAVVWLLYVFGQTQASLFLGIIIVINILMGVVQDFRSRISLEKLQLLTAFRFIRIKKDSSEELVLVDQIVKHDHIKVKIGDQIPCDGTIVESKNLEVSEALITGESDSFSRANNEKVLAGAIVTAGRAIVEVETIFADSRISKMTKDAKKYVASQSPIEMAVAQVIKYSGFILIATIIFVIVRGFFVNEPWVMIVNNVGALASVIVPQGLVVITTFLFAFGAASYSSRHVLFQEINATEKLGRIKNLCMDKTGTLTDNILVAEDLEILEGYSKEQVKNLMAKYIEGSGDSSQTIVAIEKYIESSGKEGEIVDALPFSSWRQFGAVRIKYSDGSENTILVGPPDIFLNHIKDAKEKDWLALRLKMYIKEGKRSLCLARVEGADIPRELKDVNLSLIANFVLSSSLREGIQDAVKFFQDRGIHIRIISGDNVETVSTIAASAGVLNTDKSITGADLKSWTEDDYAKKASDYSIFARIVPEQKVKLIEAFKKDGFTAMVGDGANDALAIKKSDLGIAMFDGASSSRQLAGVVLMNNSFTALPGAVRLADNFILNIQIFSSIFLLQSFLGLFFFILLSLFGYAFSMTPLNITVVNYFTVGMPGLLISYWALRPKGIIPPASTENFLKLVLPLPAILGAISAVGALIIFLLSPSYLKASSSNTFTIFSFIAFGMLFLALAPSVYHGAIDRAQKINIAVFEIIELIIMFILFKIPAFYYFFTINPQWPPLKDFYIFFLIVFVFVVIQYIVRNRFFLNKNKIGK